MPAPATTTSSRFRVPSRLSSKAVISALESGWVISADAPVNGRRIFADTADWRVAGEGWSLEIDEVGHAPRTGKEVTVTVRDRATDASLVTAAADEAPQLAADLRGDGPWAQVRRAIEDRRLLPQLESEYRSVRVSVLNDDRKTTARVLLERHLFEDPDPGGGPRPGRHLVRVATVVPVRGYAKTAERICGALTDAGLRPQPQALLATALALMGRSEPEEKLGPGVPLDRETPAATATGAVLGRLLLHVRSNEAGVRQQLDTEFLHDYRVAVRRARSILRLAGAVFPPEAVGRLKEELGWLASLTSDARDLDVHLHDLRSASGDRYALTPLVNHLSAQRESAQQVLVDAMDSLRYRALMLSWELLEHSLPDGTAAPMGTCPVGEVADELIRKAHRRVLRLGRAIDAASPPEALHDLRKRAKELRYLLECYQTLYPDDLRAAVVKELKALQDNLGEFQDGQVQAAALRAMADDLLEAGSAPAATLMAMGHLADELDGREAQARSEFQARFARFASKSNRHRVAGLVGSGGDRTG